MNVRRSHSLGTQMRYIQFIVICVISECITICAINIQFQRITAQKMLSRNKPVHIQNLNQYFRYGHETRGFFTLNPQEQR